MGFYGNITNTSKTQFQFDRIYSSRLAMENKMYTDNIYAGRYVLIEYDSTPDLGAFSRVYIKDQYAYKAPNVNATRITRAEVDIGTIVYTASNLKEDAALVPTECTFYVCTTNRVEGSTEPALWKEVIESTNSYTINYNIDNEVYKVGRGYDSTVWQKTYVDGFEKYVQIAELNSVIPTFDIAVDAPTMSPITPHFDANSTSVYYKLHVQPQWGLRVKEKENNITLSKNDKVYPSDVKSEYTKITYNPATGILDDKTFEYDGAIYYNKAGFDKNVRTHNDELDGQDIIQIEPTGLSGNKYNVHGSSKTKEQVDIQELRIILPSLGNTISDLWDLAFGQIRNQDIAWNSTEGLRLSPKLEGADAGYAYNPGEEINTIAGCINSIHDLMGMIIVDDINDPAAADYEHIYFINNKYYQKYPLYTYTPITLEVFDSVNGVYYNNDNNDYGAIGSVWNNELGFVEGVTSSLVITSQFKELEGFAHSLNTIHGLILKLNNILETDDIYSRNPNTVQGCINRLNDIFDKFNILKPKHFLTIGNDGQIHSTNWTTAQTFEAIGEESAHVEDAKENRWIYFDLDADNHKFTIEHRFNKVEDTTSKSNMNPTENNDYQNDSIQLYTPIVDNMGHTVGNNIETITLPYGYKTIKTNGIGTNSDINNDLEKYPVSDDDIIADNTQDILNINSGNKWIRIDTDKDNNTLNIQHDIHSITSDEDGTTDFTTAKENTTIPVITYNHDKAGHLINTHLENYKLPFGYGKISTGEKEDLKTITATTTYDELKFNSDIWLKVEAINDNENKVKNIVKYTHLYPNKGQDSKSEIDLNNDQKISELNLGGFSGFDKNTITLNTYSKDGTGHVTAVHQNKITLPYGYKTFIGDNEEEGDSKKGSSSANNTQASMRITGDDWIMTTVTQDLITLSHKSPKEPIIEGQDESSSTEKQDIILNFGDTFPMTDHSFDDKGHKFKSETYTVQIPELNFTSSGTGDIVTKLEFSDNNLAETKTNLGAIKLGTYQKPESLSENITGTSTLQEALIILENRINNLPTYTLTTGSNNGTVAFNNTEVTVKGLGSAAYTDAGTYATSAQGAKADSALQSNTQFKYGEEDQKTIEELFSLVFQLSAKVVELEEKIKLEHPDPELDEGNTEII